MIFFGIIHPAGNVLPNWLTFSQYFQGEILLHSLSVLELPLLNLVLISWGVLSADFARVSLVPLKISTVAMSACVMICVSILFPPLAYMFFKCRMCFSPYSQHTETLIDICDKQMRLKHFILIFIRGKGQKLISYRVYF